MPRMPHGVRSKRKSMPPQLSRDARADRLMAEMDASGVAIEDQIERLKAHFVAMKEPK